jgi:hypothetical protein
MTLNPHFDPAHGEHSAPPPSGDPGNPYGE